VALPCVKGADCSTSRPFGFVIAVVLAIGVVAILALAFPRHRR
jgi:hypothetical protein